MLEKVYWKLWTSHIVSVHIQLDGILSVKAILDFPRSLLWVVDVIHDKLMSDIGGELTMALGLLLKWTSLRSRQ